jgi:hypothetical protein
MPTKLNIQYGNDFELSFRLHQHHFVTKWIERLQLAQKQYTIDDPTRFYGFGDQQEQINNSIIRINQCISIINDYKPIIEKRLTDIADQDTLNYLHHIFEVHHGVLDQQTPEFFSMPKEVQQALADLNVLVHRCESVYRGSLPRHVVTYYGLPKTEQLQEQDYELFTDRVKFGRVFLNYVEIGKTLEDLTEDNDQYISDDAFRPWQHYSADFNVHFWTSDDRQLELKHAKIKQYYDEHYDFFSSRGYEWSDQRLTFGSIPLADLETTLSEQEILDQLADKQQVTKVEVI